MENDFADELARRLMSAREKKGISQEALGAKASISAQSISNYENARSVPSIGSLIKIAGALDAPIAQLLDNLDDRRKPLRSPRYADEAAVMRLLNGLTEAQVGTVRAIIETLNRQNWGQPVSRSRPQSKTGA